MDRDALLARLAELYPGVEVLSHEQVREAYSVLSAETEPGLISHTWMESRGLYETFGAFEGETILRKMELLAQQDNIFGWIMHRSLKNWIDRASLDGKNGGVDLGSVSTRQVLTALISQTEGDGLPLTASQAQRLLSIAETQTPRWSGLTLEYLESLYLPAWEAAYWAEQDAIQAAADQLRAENPGMSEREARDLASYRLHNPGWNDPPPPKPEDEEIPAEVGVN